MNFDPLSFVIGKHGDSGPVRDVVSYLIGRAVGTAGEVWHTLTDVAVATFTAVSTSLRELVIDVTPVQSGSGDPSPSNVRPISGWTGARIVGCGKNMYNVLNEIAGYISDIGEIIEPDAGRHTNLIPVGVGKTFTFSTINSVVRYNLRLHGYDANGNWVSQLALDPLVNMDSWGVVTATIPSGISYVAASYHYACTQQMMEIGGTRTEYAAFTGLAASSIPFPTPPGTVYGGTLTSLGDDRWKLTVTMVGIDLGTLTWTRYLETTVFISNVISGIKIPASSAVPVNALCDKLEVRAGSAGLAGSYCCNVDSNGAIWARLTSEYTTSTAFTEGVTGTTFVYELAAPVEYTITAESVHALIGQNNIFADCGNINTITYRES